MCLLGLNRLTGFPSRQRQIAYLLFWGAKSTFAGFGEKTLKNGADHTVSVEPKVSAVAMTSLEMRCAVAVSGPGAGTKTAWR